MKWFDFPRNPPTKVLRQFAAVWLVVFAISGANQFFRKGHHELGLIMLVAAIIVGVPGLFKPAAIRGLFVGAMFVAFPIGWVLSQVIMALMFYGLFMPIALTFRIFGRDLLLRKYPSNRSSFWISKKTPEDVNSYFRQY